jgi:hypothetical protein
MGGIREREGWSSAAGNHGRRRRQEVAKRDDARGGGVSELERANGVEAGVELGTTMPMTQMARRGGP